MVSKPDTRTGDRHINQALSVRLGPLQPRLEAYLEAEFGIPAGTPLMQTAIRSWVKDAVQYRLDVIQGVAFRSQSDDG